MAQTGFYGLLITRFTEENNTSKCSQIKSKQLTKNNRKQLEICYETKQNQNQVNRVSWNDNSGQ